jgi:hypothetical protein
MVSLSALKNYGEKSSDALAKVCRIFPRNLILVDARIIVQQAKSLSFQKYQRAYS